MSKKEAEAVKVVVRCRPLNSKETADGRERIVDMDVDAGQVKVRNPKSDDKEPPKVFTYDQVYDSNSKQFEIFDITAKPIIDSCMEGYNGTIFAYGQTGTGKSHTMEGRDEPPELRGIIPNTFDYIFQVIARESGNKEFLVRASYLEIYNEDIRDLLSKNPNTKLELKESGDKGVYVKDLMQFVVKSQTEINSVQTVGKKNRSVGATAMNQDSSRSHSIFTITIEMTDKFDATATAAASKDESHIRVGKLNLVDLAGSERQSKTGATGDRLKEGIKINLSLTALGNVISALVDGKSGHIPYRDSKLTRLLQDSLGGNTKTVMVANIGPADWNYDETLSTLRYANRAKNIQNKPRINEDPKDAMLREFQEEIKRLKAMIDARAAGGGGKGGGGTVVERVVEVEVEDDVAAIKERLRTEIEAKMKSDLSEEAMAAARSEAEAQARRELEAIMADSSQTEEARRRAKDALRKQHEEMQNLTKALEAERKEKEMLESKLKAMESKVLQGGVNLLEKVDELKKRSEDLKREAVARKRQEEEQRRRLLDLQDKQIDFNEKFNSMDEEVQVKSRQLKKLFEKYQAKKAETTDLQEQFQREREGMLEDYRILTQQIKLKNLVIACFIPPDYQDRIMQHCHWQDYEGAWSIDFLQYAGNAIRAHQELAAAQEAEAAADAGQLLSADSEKLQGVYFSYQSLEDEYGKAAQSHAVGGNGMAAGGKGPGSAHKGGSHRSSSTDPTNIGTLREQVQQWGAVEEEERLRASQTPKARGLVKDTVDPGLRKSVAR
ncbi:kinesin-like protein FLA10 [Haematococcus lacustris]